MLNLFVFLFLGLGLLVLLKLFTKKEIFDPLFLAPLYWIVFITVSILFSMCFHLTFYWNGILPIGLLLFSFIAGSFVFRYMQRIVFSCSDAGNENETKPMAFSLKRLKVIILLFSLLGVSSIFIQLQTLGIPIKSIEDIFHAANQISLLRYNGGVDIPKVSLFMMAFIYSASFLGGIYFLISKGLVNKLISFLPFVVIIIFTIINGVKAGLLFVTLIWLSGYISVYIYKQNGEVKNAGKLTLKVITIVVLLIVSIPITQFFRGGNQNERISLINPNTISYFGSFNAFTIWYDGYKHDRITGIKYNFSGISNIFNNDREQGLYGDHNAEIGKYENNPITTNIYTMARGLIEDFTLVGAMAILFMVGIGIQFVYLLVKKRRIWAIGFLALFYSILLMSFTLNILNYNTLLFSWIISISIIGYVKSDDSLPSHSI